MIFRTTRKVVAAIAAQRSTMTDAIAEGRVDADGDPAATARLAAIVDERIYIRMHS